MKFSKRVLASALSFTLAFSLTACGNGYKKSVEKIDEEISGKHEQLNSTDWSDTEKADAQIAEQKELYQKLADLNGKEKDSEAQQKISEGAKKMLEYYDALPEYLAIEDKNSNEGKAKQNELLNIYSSALSLLAEGKNDLGISQQGEVTEQITGDTDGLEPAQETPAADSETQE